MRVGKRMRIQKAYRKGKEKAKRAFDSEKEERVVFFVILVLSLIYYAMSGGKG